MDPFSWFMVAVATAAPGVAPVSPAIADDFRLTLGSMRRKHHLLQVEVILDNRVQAPHLFVHLEPGQPPGFVFTPSASVSAGDRSTYYLTGNGSSVIQGTLGFTVDPSVTEALLVVGEADPPYRQHATLLDLGPGEPDPSPTPDRPPVSPVAPGERVIARYHPPMPALGPEVVLQDGRSGSEGHGWARIYTEMPEVSLAHLKHAIETPQQIWLGWGGQLYLFKLSPARAIAVAVQNGAIVSARVVTKTTLGRAVGPGTQFPRRIYP